MKSPRRTFLAGAVGVAAGAALGCSKKKKKERHARAAPTSPSAAPTARPAPLPELAFGPAAADVTEGRALLWARASAAASIHFEYATSPDFDGAQVTPPAPASADGDYTLTQEISGLSPGTRYHYRAVLSHEGRAVRGLPGTFATPSDKPQPVRIVWGADLLEKEQPFRILDSIARARPDLVLLLGDLAYVDHPREAPAGTLAELRAKHRGIRRDEPLQRLLAAAPIAAVWDDHDCSNNSHREHPLLLPARRAFREYWPLRSADPSGAGLHRSFRWGPHLEIFMLDTRSFRDPPPRSLDRTMLGAAQKAWLLDGLRASKATHKIIVSSVPFLAPFLDDSWFGFPRERAEIKQVIRSERIRNVTILSGDFHLAWHLEDPATDLHEIVAGPLAAWPFQELRAKYVANVMESKRFAIMEERNYGVLEVDAAGKLSCAVFDITGKERYRTVLR